MGADFVALTPCTSARVSYSYVHTIRSKLINMVDKNLGAVFDESRKGEYDFEKINDTYHKVVKELKEMADASGDDIIIGVLAFVDHSDCDGEFYDEDCECIAKALKKLQETDKDEAVENLIKVFDNAVNDNGIVVIW